MEAKIRPVVETRRAHDFAGIVEPFRVEAVLHLLERAHQPRAEHALVKFGAHDAVAVLARMRALVGAHQREGLLGDRAHRLDVLVQFQIEHGPDVQAPFRGVRVPCAARAVLFEDFRQPGRIFGQMRQRDRAILDERDGFARVLHRHHDVQPRRAHFGDRGLQRRIDDFDHAAPFSPLTVPAEAEIADELRQTDEPLAVLVVALGEFDHEERLGIAAQKRGERRLEDRNFGREPDHRSIDELDRDRLQRDDVLRRVHRFEERSEMADPDRAPPQKR